MAIERNLELPPRPEPTREKAAPLKAEIFELDEIKTHFDESIQTIVKQFILADELVSQGKSEQAKDIWRSQIVFLDSALDFYIHELSKYGILKTFNGEWDKTEKYKNFTLTMDVAEQGIHNPEDSDWLVSFLDRTLGGDTYMSCDSIKAQLNLVGIDIQEVADRAFYVRGSTAPTKERLKQQLNRLFFRRNRIAHQADRESKNAQRADISRKDVEEFLEDVKKIVSSIHQCAAEKG